MGAAERMTEIWALKRQNQRKTKTFLGGTQNSYTDSQVSIVKRFLR